MRVPILLFFFYKKCYELVESLQQSKEPAFLHPCHKYTDDACCDMNLTSYGFLREIISSFSKHFPLNCLEKMSDSFDGQIKKAGPQKYPHLLKILMTALLQSLPHLAKADAAATTNLYQKYLNDLNIFKDKDLVSELLTLGETLPQEASSLAKEVIQSLESLISKKSETKGYYTPDQIARYAALIASSNLSEVKNIANSFLSDYAEHGDPQAVANHCYKIIAPLYEASPKEFWQALDSLMEFEKSKNKTFPLSRLLMFLARQDAEKALVHTHRWNDHNAATAPSILQELLNQSSYSDQAKYTLLLELIIQKGPTPSEAKMALHHELTVDRRQQQEGCLTSDWLNRPEGPDLSHFLRAEKALVIDNLTKAKAFVEIAEECANAFSEPDYEIIYFWQDACLLCCQYFPESVEAWHLHLKKYKEESFDNYFLHQELAEKLAKYHPELLDPILQDFEDYMSKRGNGCTSYYEYCAMANVLAPYKPDIATSYLDSAIQLREQSKDLSSQPFFKLRSLIQQYTLTIIILLSHCGLQKPL